jgi:hypothetical protein
MLFLLTDMAVIGQRQLVEFIEGSLLKAFCAANASDGASGADSCMMRAPAAAGFNIEWQRWSRLLGVTQG